jgi:hypothetical protein
MWIRLHEQEGLTIGMFKGDGDVVFTVEDIEPKDFDGQTVEFEIPIETLERILGQARTDREEETDGTERLNQQGS